MRILFLTPEVPYPPDSGGRLKTNSLIEFLRREHQLTVLCFRRRPPTEAQQRWAAVTGEVSTVLLNRGRDPLTFARSYLFGVPLSIERNRSREMASLVAGQMREQFDALFVDHWLMAQYMPAAFPGLKLLHEHNAEYLIWQREAEAATNLLLRLVLRREARRVQGYEASILRAFDAVFAVSEPDRKALLDLGARPEVMHLLPNLPDPALLEAPPLSFSDSPPTMLFLGTLSWKPNTDSAIRLLKHVLPAVRARLPDAGFLLAGRGAPDRLRSLAARTPGVEFISDVKSVEDLYRRARVFVEATTTGGGTKLKLLNALARGVPVVASPEGASGLEVTPGENVLLAPDDTAFAEAVARLMAEDDTWGRLAAAGQALVRERYLAEVAFKPLTRLLNVVEARK